MKGMLFALYLEGVRPSDSLDPWARAAGLFFENKAVPDDLLHILENDCLQQDIQTASEYLSFLPINTRLKLTLWVSPPKPLF